MEFSIVLTAAKSADAALTFVEGSGLYGAISAVSDIELEAAKLAVRNVRKASDPRREVQLAVGHLQSAHVGYRSIWKKIGTPNKTLSRRWTQYDACEKDLWVSCLMAVCYVYLNEFTLAEDSLQYAIDAKKTIDKISSHDPNWFEVLSGIAVSLVREPGVGFSDNGIPIINDTEFDEFKQAIRSFKLG